jgi:hypothetical protein
MRTNTASEFFLFQSQTGTTAQFVLLYGGTYGVFVCGLFGGGTVVLQAIGPDGSSLVSVDTGTTVSDYVVLQLPPGTYQFTVTGQTAAALAMSISTIHAS